VSWAVAAAELIAGVGRSDEQPARIIGKVIKTFFMDSSKARHSKNYAVFSEF
jgi:hypothetical protein